MFTAALFIRAQHQKKFQKPIKWGMDKQHWHSNEKGTDTRYHMDTTWTPHGWASGTLCWVKRCQTKGNVHDSIYVKFLSLERKQINVCLELEAEAEIHCRQAWGDFVEGWKYSKTRLQWQLPSCISLLKVMNMYNEWILWYNNYTTINPFLKSNSRIKLERLILAGMIRESLV